MQKALIPILAPGKILTSLCSNAPSFISASLATYIVYRSLGIVFFIGDKNSSFFASYKICPSNSTVLSVNI
ncbi:hypothetical protein VSU16_14415 (plasmid) [Cetobacterium somerae]|uniref:hypothetical protein n=1 Tax=Cetobacterium somerae TaxID=188913 RepID=UPI002E7C4022|nr:hypothetical protein [Cetobacterium somerae]WVJ03114.1 hypothetical protein VSU16_14415 [Cetobacterium somerae]